MKKFLIVGCGGSGSATQAYMMDYLRAYLSQQLGERVDTLPESWQFVSVDVPMVEEPGPQGLRNVKESGGSYVPIGKQQSYDSFDQGLSAILGKEKILGEIATWAPRHPANRLTPITNGAGQYRGIGRMLTIQSLGKIREALVDALDRVNNGTAELEGLNARLSKDTAHLADSKPLIFIVSSMAGGAGASMFLDVARLLTTIDNVQPSQIVAFLYTPEVFDSLPKDKTLGQWPNALAVFGEAVAAQFGAGFEHDARIFKAMGINGQPHASSIGRIIPVGSRMGNNAIRFGDGSPTVVYRGFGRALAAMMTSDAASHSFINYTLANTGVIESDRGLHGWGDAKTTTADTIPWGSMGYAQLATGGDQYAEYSAQRLARNAFDRLLFGHLDPAKDDTAEEQLQQLLQLNAPKFLHDVFLPERLGLLDEGSTIGWILEVFRERPDSPLRHEVMAAIERGMELITGAVPTAQGLKAREWANHIISNLHSTALNSTISAEFDTRAYAAAYRYADLLATELTNKLEEAIARYGIAYAERLINEIQSKLRDNLAVRLEQLSVGAGAISPSMSGELHTNLDSQLNSKAAVKDEAPIRRMIADHYRKDLERVFGLKLAAQLGLVIKDFAETALNPLLKNINSVHRDLEAAHELHAAKVQLADVATNDPSQWPRETDEKVAPRFRGSNNEVVLIDVDTFPHLYEGHLMAAVGGQRTFQEASPVAAREIIVGQWTTTGADLAPGDTIAPKAEDLSSEQNRMRWVSRHFRTPLSAGHEDRETTNAQFDIKLRPAQLLERSRQWITRRSYPFAQLIDKDLHRYALDISESETESRRQLLELSEAFKKALAMASPLAAVSEDMVGRAYGNGVRVKQVYDFSEIPFLNLQAADYIFSEVLPDDHTVKEAFEKALTDKKGIRSIEIFGHYPSYTPVVFSSLLPHIARTWDSLTTKDSFWTLRRSRPLPAALPLTNEERKAMVAGWLVGMATGRIEISDRGTPAARAHIFDDEHRRWWSFPERLLTPPSEMIQSYDWMAAVIESVLLAYADLHSGSPLGSSKRPYEVLRRIHDDGATGPTTGDSERSGRRLISSWLRGTDQPAGIKPAPATLEERYEQLHGYLTNFRDLAANFRPRDIAGFIPGAATGREWADVSERPIASQIPFLRDLAPDIYEVTEQLLAELPALKEAALRPVVDPTAGPGAPGFSASPMPGSEFGGLL